MTTSSLRQRTRTPRHPGRYLPQVHAFEDRLSLGDALLGSLLGSALLGNALAAPFAETAPVVTALPAQGFENTEPTPFLISMPQGVQERDAVPVSPWRSSLDFAASPSDAPFTQSAQAPRREADLLSFLVGTPSFSGDVARLGPTALRGNGTQATATPNRGQANADLLSRFAGANTPASAPAAPASRALTDDEVRANLASQPLRFEANQGQTDSQVQFLARAPGYTLFVAPTEAVMLPKRPESESGTRLGAQPAPVSMQVVGGNPNVRGVGEDRQASTVSYYHGNDPSQWVTGVSTYSAVSFANVYDGIDLRYYGQDQQLEYDFIVSPGASASTIQLAFTGADRMEIDAQGDLVLHASVGELRQPKPFTYQEVDGVRREVASAFVLGANQQVGFQVGSYDATRPLVIDPIVIFSTYVGGAGMDLATGIATDTSGAAYAVGRTDSLMTSFMGGAAGFHGPTGGTSDVFLTYLGFWGNPTVTIYIGGTQDEQPFDIVVNQFGFLFIVGETNSCNFPTNGPIIAYDATCNGNLDAFLTLLDPAWNLISSTYLGGAGDDSAYGVDVFIRDWVVLTGSTTSVNFPVTPGVFQPAHSNAGLDQDGFVTELNPFISGLAAMQYSTYVGAAGVNDAGRDVKIDSGGGDTYVTGFTGASVIPSLAVWQCMAGNANGAGFALKLRIHSGNPVWYGPVGGVNYDSGQGVAWDPILQLVYVAGESQSSLFPLFGLPVANYTAGLDAFVARVWDGGLFCVPLDYTYHGGPQDDSAFGISLAPWLDAYLTGYTESALFPNVNPPTGATFSTFNGGTRDAFAVMLDWTLTPQYSFFLGGPGIDWGRAVAFGPWTTFYAGRTDSSPTGFPLAAAARPVGALREGFVTHIW